MAFLEGYGVGLALIILIGPVLLVLVSTTIENGKGPGLAVASGIFISDIVAVSLCALGFAQFFADPVVMRWIGIGGGLLLIGLGIRYAFNETIKVKFGQWDGTTSALGFLGQGFLVNFVNPFVFVIWMGIVAGGTGRHGVGLGLFWFLSGSILAVFTLDVSKVFLANHIKRVLRKNVLKWVFQGSGLLMVLFGVRLILFGFYKEI